MLTHITVQIYKALIQNKQDSYNKHTILQNTLVKKHRQKIGKKANKVKINKTLIKKKIQYLLNFK